MDKTYIERKLKENEEKKDEARLKIFSFLEKTSKEFEGWNPVEDNEIKIKALKYNRFNQYKSEIIKSIDNPNELSTIIVGFNVFAALFQEPEAIARNIKDLSECLDKYNQYTLNEYHIKDLEDSKPIHFSGDIIITDPCYLMNKKSDRDDWGFCSCGYELNKLEFTKYLQRDTIIGDWSCTVFDIEDNSKIYGHFCADSGEVCVVLAEEAFNYNPDFEKEYLKDRDWCATIIKDFEGDIYFRIDEDKFMYEGKECVDYDVKVVLDGINKKTGEPIHLISSQTGF